MRGLNNRMIGGLLAAATLLHTASMPAQAADPAQGAAAPHDSPEEIAADAARDLRDNRFYNRPGATRADYDADWQRCRLIARGSRTPAGSVPMFYNPNYVSPLAAGIGAGLGGAIAAAIIEGQQRRDNRRNCLLIGGWRLVELPTAETTRVAALPEAQRTAYFNTIVGARDVPGKVTARTRFSLAPDTNLHPDQPLLQPGSLSADRKTNLDAPFAAGPGEGVIVLAYRRAETAAAGRSAAVDIARYDAASKDLVYQPKDWKKKGDTTTYHMLVGSLDRRSAYEVRLIKLTAGDYVINATAAGTVLTVATNCFGAPTFHLGAGEVAYLGDFVPYVNAKLSSGDSLTELGYAAHLEDARKVLATRQPAIAAALRPATLHNGATYACAGAVMTRWDIEPARQYRRPGGKRRARGRCCGIVTV